MSRSTTARGGERATRRLPGVLLPLRHRDYRLLAFASLVSLLGDGFFLVAIALQVYAITDDNTAAFGAVGTVWAGAAVLTYLIGGWASDRFERRRIMIAADVVRGFAIGLMGLLGVTGVLRLGHVLVLGAIFGSGNAFFNPAATAIVPDLLPSEDLSKANAFLGVAKPAMVRFAGPALGGLVVAATAPGVAFLIDAATFALSAAMLSLIKTRPTPCGESVGGGSGESVGGGSPNSVSLVANVREGLSFVRAHPWCRTYTVGLGLSLLAWWGPVEVLLPLVLKTELGLGADGAARQLGLILASGGVGAIVASVVVGQRDDLPQRFVMIMFGVEAVAILCICTYGLMTASWQGMVAALAANGLFAIGQIYWSTMLQRLVPGRLLGRVSSVDWLIGIGLLPVSFAVAGTLGTLLGPRTMILGAGLLGSAVMFALLFVPGVRAPESMPEARAPEPEPAGQSAS